VFGQLPAGLTLGKLVSFDIDTDTQPAIDVLGLGTNAPLIPPSLAPSPDRPPVGAHSIAPEKRPRRGGAEGLRLRHRDRDRGRESALA
jgi:hypothetical protein